MRRPWRSWGLTAVVVTAALLPAACTAGHGPRGGRAPAAATAAPALAAAELNGEQAKPAARVLADVRAAFATARSVHVSGRLGGPGALVLLDLRLGRGGEATGTVVVNGTTVELIRVGRRVWVRGRDLWAQVGGAAAARRFGDRWVELPTAGSQGAALLGQLAGLTDLDGFAASVLTPDGPVAKGPITRVAGRPAVGLRDRSGDGTLYVSLVGPPLPLHVTPPDGGGLDFDRYGEPVAARAPAGALRLGAGSG